MANEPVIIDGLETPANNIRAGLAATMRYGGRNVGARWGIRPGGNPFELTIVGSTITVQPGIMIFDPAWNASQAPYAWGMLSAFGGTLQAPDISTRRDVIAAEILDDNVDAHPADGDKLAQLRYIVGTGSEPTLTQNQYRLWSIEVPPADPAVKTDRRQWTTAAGGILRVPDNATMLALPDPGIGETIWREDVKALYVFGANSAGNGWARVSVGATQTLTGTNGLTQAPSGWAATWTATLDYPFVDFELECVRNGGNIPATDGNIGDTLMCTISSAAFRPGKTKEYHGSNGVGGGSVRIGNDGAVFVRTFTGANLGNATTVRVSSMYRVA
ncbi:MAG: hypothetical protein HOQ43_10940 [Glycomyces artemisiae]|uniref:Uncharacterized protein n=1 Tax=Glycomyces artemisiae TaxID=1076443 RepID=A0A850CAW2_9ACTN|nr:hypothetical protein [Glycomyces artemisiae]